MSTTQLAGDLRGPDGTLALSPVIQEQLKPDTKGFLVKLGLVAFIAALLGLSYYPAEVNNWSYLVTDAGNMGLLHGSQADALVMCHEPTRKHMRGLPDFSLPEINHCIALNEQCGRLTNPACRVVGVSVNTVALGEDEAHAVLAAVSKETGLPATDAYRFGAGPLVDNL